MGNMNWPEPGIPHPWLDLPCSQKATIGVPLILHWAGGEELLPVKFKKINPLIVLRLNLSNLVFAPPLPFPAIAKPLVFIGFRTDFERLTTLYTSGPFQSG